MRLEKMTLKAQEAVQEGQTLARRANHPSYEPEHLATALLSQSETMALPILRKIGTDTRLLQQRVDESLARLPKIEGGAGATLSQRLLSTFDRAEDSAKAMKDEYTSSEHLLLALTQDKGPLGEILKSS